MGNYYVFRIHTGEKFEFIREELKAGRLRQGWGAKGMAIDDSVEKFIQAWNDKWGKEDSSEDRKKRKYNNLAKMKEISVGDYIIIPKISIQDGYEAPWRYFTVAKCKKEYEFKLPEKYDDFGHVIEVEVLFSCSYKYNKDSLLVSGKFRAYQYSINNVWNDSFKKSIDNLIEENKENKISCDYVSKTLMYTIASSVSEKYEEMIESVKISLGQLSPQTFENIISELFEKNNFVKIGGNDYDGNGGDIDITLGFDDKLLLGNIFKVSETIVSPNINIQAKKKPGEDHYDYKAVEQLINRRKSKGREMMLDINIVIDLADDFQDATKKLAEDNNIILINGNQFASLVIQFGLGGEIDL
ncbi:restriction endonuclease [Eubacterium sp.]|uniref:restriction endonuclease n=1 Tax=Eubacterium sp. TaxID=142586 RepID=UPI0025D26419|nr:restriction endonuclease [Eubacterium sp.]MCR5629976.1 restriction endonuclease [Eubacterium sp.]